MMLANHTCIAQIFQRTVNQYDKIRKRNAFIDNYRKEPMFADNLDEFDMSVSLSTEFARPCHLNSNAAILRRSREVVTSLVEEYKAAESPHYSTWGLEHQAGEEAES